MVVAVAAGATAVVAAEVVPMLLLLP
jgi:hypothetical protein